MEISKNSRQVPSTKEVCSSKLYSDTLYAYLQCISQWDIDTDIRYVNKKDINFSALEEIFEVSRQTISKKFKDLLKMGLVQEDEMNKRYILVILPQKEAYLVPHSTLVQLSHAFNEKSISTYVYLFNRFIMNNYKPYEFTLEQIKTWVGISTKTRSNDVVITSILNVLFNCGLIDFKIVEKTSRDDNFLNVKTMYQLTGVNTKLKTPTVERIKIKN